MTQIVFILLSADKDSKSASVKGVSTIGDNE